MKKLREGSVGEVAGRFGGADEIWGFPLGFYQF
jgi:hypothetical protein